MTSSGLPPGPLGEAASAAGPAPGAGLTGAAALAPAVEMLGHRLAGPLELVERAVDGRHVVVASSPR